MKALRVFIVDDEAPARGRLRDVLGDIAGELPVTVVGEAGDGVEALRSLGEAGVQAVDVVLVDIRMPRMDGIELARHLAAFESPPAVIFTTAYDAYAVQAFELNAIDYLLKPVRAQRLLAALRKVRPGWIPDAVLRQMMPEGRSHLSCHERGRLLLVPVDEILYLRADTKYVAARTREREFLLDESLTQLEEEYGARFLRLHRGVLIARAALVGFERAGGDEAEHHWLALVRDLSDKLPISRRQWPSVKEAARHLASG